MTNGLLSLRSTSPKTPKNIQPDIAVQGGTHAHFVRGKLAVEKITHLITKPTRSKLTRFEQNLRKFEYKAAIMACLTPPTDPNVVHALLNELVHRDALTSTITTLEPPQVIAVLRFISKQICRSQYKFTTLLIKIMTLIIGTPKLIFRNA